MRRYYHIPKDKFEDVIFYLNGREYFSYEYKIDEEYRKAQKIHAVEYKEHCYIVDITQNFCIKVYSSIKREGKEVSRDKGKDSIKVVAACNCLSPIHDPYSITERLETWEHNFKEQLLEVLISLGNVGKCPKGNHIMELKRNNQNGKIFIGCTHFLTSGCRGSSNITINQGIHCPKIKHGDQIFPYRY